MASHCFSSTSAAVCVCAYSVLVWGKLQQNKQGLKGHTVKVVQHQPSNETDTFPPCNELVLRPHCLVCIIIYSYKKRVPYQISRGDTSYQIKSSHGNSAKSRLI